MSRHIKPWRPVNSHFIPAEFDSSEFSEVLKLNSWKMTQITPIDGNNWIESLIKWDLWRTISTEHMETELSVTRDKIFFGQTNQKFESQSDDIRFDANKLLASYSFYCDLQPSEEAAPNMILWR